MYAYPCCPCQAAHLRYMFVESSSLLWPFFATLLAMCSLLAKTITVICLARCVSTWILNPVSRQKVSRPRFTANGYDGAGTHMYIHIHIYIYIYACID